MRSHHGLNPRPHPHLSQIVNNTYTRTYRSRDYHHKIKNIAWLMSTGRFKSRMLDTWSKHNLEHTRLHLDMTATRDLDISPRRRLDIQAQLLKAIERHDNIPHFASPNPSNKPVRKVLAVPFNSPVIFDTLNLNQIFHRHFTSKNLSSIVIENTTHPLWQFKYGRTVRSIMDNTKDFISTLSDINNILTSPCACNPDSPFYDPHHKHIVTSDPDIVDDLNLRELLKRGAKYRPNACDDADQSDTVGLKKLARLSITEVLESYVEGLQNKYQLPQAEFEDFMDLFMTDVDAHLDKLSLDELNTAHLTHPPVSKAAIRTHQGRFILSYVDKSANCVCHVCPKFYLQIIINEHFPNCIMSDRTT
jgi:hypothetical protein